jgi:cytochrome c
MDSFELNKIAGAVLGTCLFLLSMNIVAGSLFHAHKPEKMGFEIAVPETPAGGTAQAAAGPVEPIEVRLASSSVEKGLAAAKKCVACHDFTKGGPNKVGPNLWGIVGSNKAHLGNFAYSGGMKGMEGSWTVEDLDKFLTNPRGVVKGTTMAFAGVSRPAERADIIAYLNSLADSPKPLPAAK